ncbi:MAG: RAMP superfamily CRISPR-associated protein [Candidatus Heimdallarchaeota archaeon]
MTQAANKKVSKKVKRCLNPRKVLKVFCYTPISKPLNGSMPKSNTTYFLKLYPIPYTYGNGKEKKEAEVFTYLIKGLRGAIRHSAMSILYELDIEACHSSDKETDKEGNSLIPHGFHLLGSCVGNGECLIHQIFGSKGHKSLISVYADPIGAIKHKTAQLDQTVQKVHMTTENRVNISFEGKSIQNFGEQSFSGYFSFEIDVTELNSLQLGFILQCILGIEKLGRGFNAGYGHVEVKEFQLLNRITEKRPKWQENKFKILKEIQEESLKKEVESAMQEWENSSDISS